MELIRDFKNLTKNDIAIAGGKGASLGEMTKADIPVPPGFVILSTAFEKFLEETDLNVEIDSILRSVNHKEIHTIDDASEKIKALILNAKMPQDIVKEIQNSFKKLSSKYVAVRSSATAEDSAIAAWAGQLETYLNSTEKTLLDNVKKCWASLFTPRAIFYRFEKELHKQKISVAVVVQKMIDSEVSGVAFSVHPVTQDKNQLIIEASFGLGEAIVSGQITPDSYVVKKEPRQIIDKNVQVQNRGLYRSGKGGNEWCDIPKEQGEKQVLSDKEILEFSEIVLRIEKHYGFPVDIEWAAEKGKFYIVQSRPITTLGKKEVKKVFTKEHSREYSLFRTYIIHKIMDDYLEKLIEKGPYESCSIYEGRDLTSVYYEKESFKRIFMNIMNTYNDLDHAKKEINKFLEIFNQIKPYFLGEKKPSDINELKQLMDLYLKLWAYIGIVYTIPKIPQIDEEVKKIALEAREKTQEYNEALEPVIIKFLKKQYPKFRNKTRFILPNEVWDGEVEDSNFENKIKERSKGFVYYREKIYTGDIKKKLDELGITLEKKEIKGNIKEIKGQIANKGIVKGKVKIVSSIKDLKKVSKGNILVAAMTMPKYLPAMKRSAAFVTDEGGVTCHAAITSRELGKPCIIGTKIATQALKDGDLVEVDANNGIVKKLSK